MRLAGVCSGRALVLHRSCQVEGKCSHSFAEEQELELELERSGRSRSLRVAFLESVVEDLRGGEGQASSIAVAAVVVVLRSS